MKEPKFKAEMIAWSPFDGFEKTRDQKNEVYPILHGEHAYRIDGKFSGHDKHPTLLTVEEAAKLGYEMTRADKSRLGLLKRRVVTIEKWTNAYKDGKKSLIYDTYEEARNNASSSKNYLFPVKITGTYEIEVES